MHLARLDLDEAQASRLAGKGSEHSTCRARHRGMRLMLGLIPGGQQG